MRTLLEIREYMKGFWSRYSQAVTIGVKFLITLLALNLINSRIGYNEQLAGILPALLISLLCSLIPYGAICGILAVVILVHLWSLSMPVFAVAAIIFLLMFLLYFRFSPGDGILIILTPLLSVIGIPYVIPIAAGLLYTPASIISVIFGIIIQSILTFVPANETQLTASTADEIVTALKLAMDGIFRNSTMIVLIFAFACTIAVVYVIRRLRIANAWIIGSGAGSVVCLIILIIGGIGYDTNLNIAAAFLGITVSFLISLVLTFFFFNLDYTRIESLQFEDDDYYYYVKAVPKVSVKTPKRTVKTISHGRGYETGYEPENRYRNSRDSYDGAEDRDSYYEDIPSDEDRGYAESQTGYMPGDTEYSDSLSDNLSDSLSDDLSGDGTGYPSGYEDNNRTMDLSGEDGFIDDRAGRSGQNRR